MMLSLRVFGHELRKIWRLPLLAVIALFGVMSFYALEQNHWVKTQVWQMCGAVAVVSDLMEEYGSTLNYSDWRDMQSIVERYQAELDDFVWEQPGDHMTEFLLIDKLETATEMQESLERYFARNPTAEVNIFFGRILLHTNEFYSTVIITIVVAVAILLLPYLIRDYKSKAQVLQFSSRKGRRIVRTQIAAMMFSAALLTAIMFAVYTGVYFWHNPEFLLFLNQQTAVVSAFEPHSMWLNPTYWQFIAIIAGFIMISAVAMTGILFCLLQNTRDYVSAILKGIPVAAVTAYFSGGVIWEVFTTDGMYSLFPIIGIEFILSGGLLALGIGLCVFACRRVMGRDLL